MSEEERQNKEFFPEHLHVLREKMDAERKASSRSRSVGALPGKSRKRQLEENKVKNAKKAAAMEGARLTKNPHPPLTVARICGCVCPARCQLTTCYLLSSGIVCDDHLFVPSFASSSSSSRRCSRRRLAAFQGASEPDEQDGNGVEQKD